jgi:hypothetical protein
MENKYQEYKNKLKEPIIHNSYTDAILRVIIDFEDRVENDNVLMLGIMDIEKIISLIEEYEKLREYLDDINLIEIDEDEGEQNE